jgi:hypothetical protein
VLHIALTNRLKYRQQLQCARFTEVSPRNFAQDICAAFQFYAVRNTFIVNNTISYESSR